MKVLVTGSAGRVGRNIYIHLMRTHKVVGLDITPCSTVDYVGDIRDPKIVKSALKGVDVVVHSAALHAPHINVYSDEEFVDVNVNATEQLANIAINQGVEHVIFTSTTAQYGVGSSIKNELTAWITEDTIPSPRTIYHKSKIQAESLLERLSEQTELPVTVLQMSRCFPEAADSMAIYRLNRGIDARDVALAHACAISVRPKGFTRFIISGKTPFSSQDCRKLYLQADQVIRKCVPELADEFARRAWELPSSIDRVYDSSLAQRELNWTPIHGYKEVFTLLDNCIAEVLPVTK